MGMEGFVDKVIILYCNLPNLGSSGSIRAYDGIGGGVAGDVAFGPQSGRIAVSFGIDVGVGFGGSVGFSPSSSLTVGRNVASGISASIGVNANVRGGPYAGGGSATLIGRNGPGFGGFSAGLRPGGTGVSANANVGGRVGFGLQILPACPTRGR